jgi:hypothetical protein
MRQTDGTDKSLLYRWEKNGESRTVIDDVFRPTV